MIAKQSDAITCYSCSSGNDGSGACGTSFVSSSTSQDCGSTDVATACIVSISKFNLKSIHLYIFIFFVI